MKPLYSTLFFLLSATPVLAAELFEGTWKLSPEQSQIGNAPDDWKTATMTITKIGPKEFRSTMDGTLKSGKAVHFEIDRTLDGKEHSLKTKGLTTAGGSITAERLDAHTRKMIEKKEGKVSSEIVSTVSADGKTMKNVEHDADGTQFVMVLEKQ